MIVGLFFPFSILRILFRVEPLGFIRFTFDKALLKLENEKLSDIAAPNSARLLRNVRC